MRMTIIKEDDMLGNKTKYTILPWDGVDAVARLMTDMEEKYPELVWPYMTSHDHINASIRHIRGWLSERYDEESGESHLVHAATRLLMAVQVEGYERDEEDACSITPQGPDGNGSERQAGGFLHEDDDEEEEEEDEWGLEESVYLNEVILSKLLGSLLTDNSQREEVESKL